MSAGRDSGGGGGVDGSGGCFHAVQPLRDPQSNWSVDLAKNLEEYLFKICSGEISGEDGNHLSVNFAEAALLLQGSIQVYSRKVEYLYTLVLNALEFISQKRQQDQGESSSGQTEESGCHPVSSEDSDIYWDLDEVQVEAKGINLTTHKDAPLNHFSKPPANLVVLEGDCLDNSGDGGDLESYLLATSNLYQDFILLDPCDAVSLDEFLKENNADKPHGCVYKTNNLSSRKNFQSPSRQSGGTARKSSVRKTQDVNLDQAPLFSPDTGANNQDIGSDPPPHDSSENNFDCTVDDVNHGHQYSDDEDDEDPWKPLNPHEPGDLKIKPHKKVKASKRPEVNPSIKQIHREFPLAKLRDPISSELTEIWRTNCCASERQHESRSPSLYEKLRQSLVNRVQEMCDDFSNVDINNDDNAYDDGGPEFGQPDFDIPESMQMDGGVPHPNDKHVDDAVHVDSNDASEHEDHSSQKNLEDLCRSHLDALLASIAETENQTELAARVSSWKQNIEQNLEEQESHPPFDIHHYGNIIMDKLALQADSGNSLSYLDIVQGQEKHDVARSFSSLLQLVNNGSVELDKRGGDGKSICFTSENPFYVQLLGHDRQQEGQRFEQPLKKGGKSPKRKRDVKGDPKLAREKSRRLGSSSSPGFKTSMTASQHYSKFSADPRNIRSSRCTPESKRRRRALVEPIDMPSAG